MTHLLSLSWRMIPFPQPAFAFVKSDICSGHGLDAFGMHLACCLFRGQRITTHNAIRDIMYAFTTNYMERAVVCPYVKSFITKWS
jgi:hypothetical protein